MGLFIDIILITQLHNLNQENRWQLTAYISYFPACTGSTVIWIVWGAKMGVGIDVSHIGWWGVTGYQW